MARFIAISGPSCTGKTELVNALREDDRFREVVFSPDFYDVVWRDLVDQGYFTEYSEIATDQDYLCTYLIRVIDYYNDYLDSFEDSDTLVILDGSWVDFSTYALLAMWYTRAIGSLQEEILNKASKFDSRISRIYITQEEDRNFPATKFHMRGKISSFRANRSLEVKYYDLAKNLKNAIGLKTSDISTNRDRIFSDLKYLGYL